MFQCTVMVAVISSLSMYQTEHINTILVSTHTHTWTQSAQAQAAHACIICTNAMAAAVVSGAQSLLLHGKHPLLHPDRTGCFSCTDRAIALQARHEKHRHKE
eukprot:GHRR01035181.1.p4 GENE.GHRR01035181.1~~GHRR01035181.1.p4  ORF type:complete len:102 (-),score=17.10 GHRR01035181.1:673-978(-)